MLMDELVYVNKCMLIVLVTGEILTLVIKSFNFLNSKDIPAHFSSFFLNPINHLCSIILNLGKWTVTNIQMHIS